MCVSVPKNIWVIIAKKSTTVTIDHASIVGSVKSQDSGLTTNVNAVKSIRDDIVKVNMLIKNR